MADPDRAGGGAPPQFGYTVDEDLLPHQQVPRPMAVRVAMGLIPVIVVLGAGGLVVAAHARTGMSFGDDAQVQAVFWLALGLATLELLLWRGLAELRIVVFAVIGIGLAAEVLFGLVGLRDTRPDPDKPIAPVYLAVLAAIGFAQVLAVAALVIALTRREVGDWVKAVRRLRYEHKRRAGQPWW